MTINLHIDNLQSLKNKCFHNFKNGKLYNQGKVLEVHEDYIVAVLYEWCMGEPNGTKQFSFNQIKEMGFIFYKNNKEMNEAWENAKREEDGTFNQWC